MGLRWGLERQAPQETSGITITPSTAARELLRGKQVEFTHCSSIYEDFGFFRRGILAGLALKEQTGAGLRGKQREKEVMILSLHPNP